MSTVVEKLSQRVANAASPIQNSPAARVLITFPLYNEEDKVVQLVEKLVKVKVGKILAVNDGSTDGGPGILRRCGIEVVDQPHSGVGACIKRAVAYAQAHGYDILVVMAGNNKDDPQEIPRLLEPIVNWGYDYVQGSRFLPGGSSPHLPLFRRAAIKVLSALFLLYSWKRCTDLTNGFRAYRLSLFDDARLNVWQPWLDQYEYEYYVHWKAYTLGYKVAEVPVTKSYPAQKGVKYSKIRPFSGWWSMLRPFVLLALRIKK